MQFNPLKRRDFITLLGGAAAAWPLASVRSNASGTTIGPRHSWDPNTPNSSEMLSKAFV